MHRSCVNRFGQNYVQTTFLAGISSNIRRSYTVLANSLCKPLEASSFFGGLATRSQRLLHSFRLAYLLGIAVTVDSGRCSQLRKPGGAL